MDYYVKNSEWTRARVGEKPVPPKCVLLYQYIINLCHIISNCVIELILAECEKFGNIVGSKDKDIVSNYAELTDLEIKLSSFIDKDLTEFKHSEEEKNDGNVRNPITEFMNRFKFDEDRDVVRFDNNSWTWPVSYDAINTDFKRKTKQLSKAVIDKIPVYFKKDNRDLMLNIGYLFDPKCYAVYNSQNDASLHGDNVMESVLSYFSVKRLKIGRTESFRLYKWRNFDKNKFKCEYGTLRQLLWSQRNIYPDNYTTRLKSVWLQMEQRQSAFSNCFMLLTKVLCLFSGIIDVERQNGIKKWICNAKRDSLLTSKLDQILRIYCNAPSMEDEYCKQWLTEVVKIYWAAANRSIDCKELDKICEEEEEDIDML